MARKLVKGVDAYFNGRSIPGWVEVQADDEERVFKSDDAAARAVSRAATQTDLFVMFRAAAPNKRADSVLFSHHHLAFPASRQIDAVLVPGWVAYKAGLIDERLLHLVNTSYT